MNVHDPPRITRRDDEQIQPARQTDQIDLRLIAERENATAEFGQIAAGLAVDEMMIETGVDRPPASPEPGFGGDDEADVNVQPTRGFLIEKVLKRAA